MNKSLLRIYIVVVSVSSLARFLYPICTHAYEGPISSHCGAPGVSHPTAMSAVWDCVMKDVVMLRILSVSVKN